MKETNSQTQPAKQTDKQASQAGLKAYTSEGIAGGAQPDSVAQGEGLHGAQVGANSLREA